MDRPSSATRADADDDESASTRGIGVTVFRQAGFTEGKVALWTCVLFGIAHATNIFSEGISSLGQVLITVVAGYFFYLIRRVSGLLIVSMIVHGLWDFGLLTNTMSTPMGSASPPSSSRTSSWPSWRR